MKRISVELLYLALTIATGASVALASDANQSSNKGEGDSNASKPSVSQHWAFQRPNRPAIPETKTHESIRNPIDSFIIASLEKENFKLSPEADRRTLIRRLSLDLLGLPPGVEEVRAFVDDDRPEAYELLVDRLLASPHFGERWARHWLDLARYADSDGYEKDSFRPYAFLYRDWVINAINRDLPFDEFSIEQIAGDLMPGATQDQKIATGFHRNTLTNKEGGVDQEEFRCKANVDRVSTTGLVWLGLTVGCAECHNHKYDPISQREFYQVYAFFNNASEKDLPAPRTVELAQFKKEKRRWDAEHERLKSELANYIETSVATKQAAWEQSVIPPREKWTVLSPDKVLTDAGSKLKVRSDHFVRIAGSNPEKLSLFVQMPEGMTNITGFRIELMKDPTPSKTAVQSTDASFILREFSVKIDKSSSRSRGDGADSTNADEITLQQPSTTFPLKNDRKDAANDGDLKTGWTIPLESGQRQVAVFETKEDRKLEIGGTLLLEINERLGDLRLPVLLRISATCSQRPFEANLMPDAIEETLAAPSGHRSESSKKALAKYFREEVDPEARELRGRLAEHAKQEPKFPETKAPTMSENETPRRTNIHIRGDFLRKGDEVEPGTPAVLHAFSPHSPNAKANRLDLARWLFDPANPLTARVTANRIWYHLFGRGLVATLNDFGTRGEKPSHPDLLDWLATEFERLNWSRKALMKTMVMSATYRQSSLGREDLEERDPSNNLFSRQNRFRVEAEVVRDVHLAVSGLLNPLLGGPSIRPPLPADIAALGYANSVKWQESKGANKYRRGLYIHFQRTVPYPMLTMFDAPDSNETCTRRERSDTPLQALTLLNDPVFFECASSLARETVRNCGPDATERIARLFERCLSREPSEQELARLKQLYEVWLKLIRRNPANATKIIGKDPASANAFIETAALVGVSRAILNLDEFVTRE